MITDSQSDTSDSYNTARQLKTFTHLILQQLMRATPIWGFPAILAGDGYPFVNQHAKQVATLMIDVQTEPELYHTIPLLGLILSESIRLYSEEKDTLSVQGMQMLTLNNGTGRYSFILQSLSCRDLGALPYFLQTHRYYILKRAFETIDGVSHHRSEHKSTHYIM